MRHDASLATGLPALLGCIAHFGRTAVPGMVARPIIDMQSRFRVQEQARLPIKTTGVAMADWNKVTHACCPETAISGMIADRGEGTLPQFAAGR